MTNEEAANLKSMLESHYGCRVAPVNEFCGTVDLFFSLEGVRNTLTDEQKSALASVRSFTVGKSCLLDRMLYGGEEPSKVPCPVHKGTWSGIHIGWPGQKWSNGRDVDVSPQCQAWYDEGCRCFQHTCGCTTGWQPKETK